MNKSNKTKLFLISSLIILVTFFMGTMSVFSFAVKDKNKEVISGIGNVYTSGVSREITLHFETVINLQIDKATPILKTVPDNIEEYREETVRHLINVGQNHGYEYMGLMGPDGSMETLFGEDMIIADPEPFINSMNNGERKAAIAGRIFDSDNNSINDVIALGVSASYPMKKGGRSAALVVGIPMSTLSLPLSLAMENNDILIYSYVIRSDGSFIIKSPSVAEDSYFDRMRNSYHTEGGGDIEDTIAGLHSCMEKNENFFENFYVYTEKPSDLENTKHAIFCTRLSNSEWYLISVMPYNTINGIIEDANRVQQAMYTAAVSVMLIVIIIIFILYFRMTWRQLKEMDLARREAMQANKAKRESLSNMSHDIRTPMNAIVGMTAIAAAHIDDRNQVQTCLKKISLSGKHLLGLINDILDMSKIESGKMTLNMDMISLREVMDNIVNIVQPQIKAKNQNFEVSIYGIKTENVYCDSVRLNQVILNLMSNAIKFTHDGGSIQTVMYQEDSEKGDNYIRVRIKVKDNGIGMSPEFKEKIFESFVREDTKRVNTTEGSGLGMAITKYIVDAMEGTIEVDSEPGKGTEFRITVDLEKAPDTEAAMQLPNWKMLVVDDDKTLCQSSADSLKEIGVNAEWTLNAENAFKMIEESHSKGVPYDIILIDWKLPGMDGIEATRIIRGKLNSNVPVILISAYDWSEIEAEARSAGVTGFIGKPLFKSTLYYGLRRFSGELESTDNNAAKEEENRSLVNMRVLLAEDNELNREIACELLAPEGLIMDCAENGKVCVEMFEKAPEGYYSAILMDLRMPVMSGLEASVAIRRLDRSDKDIPIIAMTADAFAEDKEKCIEAGMNAHITKPIDVDEVIKTIEKYVK